VNEQRKGVWYAVAAYGLWGVVPLYFRELVPAGAGEILAHRMAWSLVVMLLVVLIARRLTHLRAVLRQRRAVGLLAVAAVLVSVNWGTYIWAITNGHVVEAALGYFINPLVTIAFGVLLLRDRLRPAQWAAVGIGTAAVLVLAIGYGKPPWISLILAFSFGTYGLLKKKAAVDGMESLTVETAVQFLPALAFIIWLAVSGGGVFGRTGAAADGATFGPGHWLLLAGTGLVTAGPLLFFGVAAVRVPLATIGMLQYLAPVLQFILGLAVFHEEMPGVRWAGFALVWLALAVLTADALRAARASRRRMVEGTSVQATANPPTEVCDATELSTNADAPSASRRG
jgi:chloramphenicol-sensitive protein RarD